MRDLVNIPLSRDFVRGAVEVDQTERGLLPQRLPRWAREQIADPQLSLSASQPSGVRVAMRTAARTVQLDTIPTKREYVGAPPRPDGVYDLVVDGRHTGSGSVPGGDVVRIDMVSGSHESEHGVPGTVSFSGLREGMKEIEIWLPHDETTVLVGLRADAAVHRPEPSSLPVWVHHGSSISQGSNASSPTGTWPVVAARLAGFQLTNLGFGGGALLDPATARSLRDLTIPLGPRDLVSVAIGINVVNADLMRRRAFAPAVHGFLDTIREGNTEVPLVVVSPLLCPLHEDTPGPLAPDHRAMAEGRVGWRATGAAAEVARGALSLRVLREELERVVTERRATDARLGLVSGLELYGEADSNRLPLPDGLHPGPTSHVEIGERFAHLVRGASPLVPAGD